MTKLQAYGSRQLSPPFVLRLSKDEHTLARQRWFVVREPHHERGTTERYVRAEVPCLKTLVVHRMGSAESLP